MVCPDREITGFRSDQWGAKESIAMRRAQGRCQDRRNADGPLLKWPLAGLSQRSDLVEAIATPHVSRCICVPHEACEACNSSHRQEAIFKPARMALLCEGGGQFFRIFYRRVTFISRKARYTDRHIRKPSRRQCPWRWMRRFLADLPMFQFTSKN